MDAGKFSENLKQTSLFKMLLSVKHLLLPIVASLLPLPVRAETPATPGLAYLYTAYVHCTGNLMEPVTEGPHGLRKAIPIVGGNFTGPRLSGIIFFQACCSQLLMRKRQDP